MTNIEYLEMSLFSIKGEAESCREEYIKLARSTQDTTLKNKFYGKAEALKDIANTVTMYASFYHNNKDTFGKGADKNEA